MEIRYHPLFERWLAALAEADEEIFRILYAICRTDLGGEVGVILLGGDKTELENLWYPANLNEAEHRLDRYCRQHKDVSPIVKRGNG